MGCGVTDTGSQRPSGRRRRPRNRAWRRARPGFGEATLSLLWSVLGHIIVVGALILHFAGRTPDIHGIEIFAAEPWAETEQLPLKEVAQADTSAPRRPSPIRLNISARGPESGPPGGPHKTRPASTPSAPVMPTEKEFRKTSSRPTNGSHWPRRMGLAMQRTSKALSTRSSRRRRKPKQTNSSALPFRPRRRPIRILIR